MTKQQPSLIIASAHVNPDWLFDVLPDVWFVGRFEPEHRLIPNDCRPRLVDWCGQERGGGLS